MLFDVLHAVFLCAGTLFLLAAAIGVVKFPDFYARLHAAGKGDTLGQALVLVGLILGAGFTLVSLKLALVIFFVFVFNPTATHALARGAWVCGLRPWREENRGKPFVQREGQLSEQDRREILGLEDTEAEEG
jgi:multicomponent Na+:H+ antiporter subunit G